MVHSLNCMSQSEVLQAFWKLQFQLVTKPSPFICPILPLLKTHLSFHPKIFTLVMLLYSWYLCSAVWFSFMSENSKLIRKRTRNLMLHGSFVEHQTFFIVDLCGSDLRDIMSSSAKLSIVWRDMIYLVIQTRIQYLVGYIGQQLTVTTCLPKIISLVINLCQNHERILLSWHANLNDTIKFS